MKSVLIPTILIAANSLFAQTTQTTTTGQGYRQQSYIKLAEGTEKIVDNTSWDIAFSVFGESDAGIFINESAGTSMGQPLPEVGAFDSGSFEWNEDHDPEQAADLRLYNSEKSWEFGAFNEVHNPDDPLDFGWGIYNPQTNEIEGAYVFLIQLRDQQYKKIQFLSLADNKYTFRYADLDGSNEVTATIDKSDFPGQTLAYYSIETESIIDVEPAGGYDFQFSRYITLLDAGTGVPIPYAVTGILTGHDVEVAEARGINPATVEFSDYQDSLRTELDIIGHDWKNFTGAEWQLAGDRAYFIKTSDDHIWKINFTEFGGSITGTAEFEKTDLGIISAISDPTAIGFKVLAYPNPTESVLYLSLDVPASYNANGRLLVMDNIGRIQYQHELQLHEGFNVFELTTASWTPGIYHLLLEVNEHRIQLGSVSR